MAHLLIRLRDDLPVGLLKQLDKVHSHSQFNESVKRQKIILVGWDIDFQNIDGSVELEKDSDSDIFLHAVVETSLAPYQEDIVWTWMQANVGSLKF